MTTTHNPSDARMTAQAPCESRLDVDALAQEIRRVDGSHSLGAGALAEALAPYIDALPERAPVSAGGAEPRFFVDHGMVHDRKTGKHLVGCNYAGETPEALIAVLRELENDRDAWRLTAKTLDAATPAPPVGADWVMVPRVATDAMKEAAAKIVFANANAEFEGDGSFAEKVVLDTQDACYHAMLAAAPTPAEARGVGDGRVREIKSAVIQELAALVQLGEPEAARRRLGDAFPIELLNRESVMNIVLRLKDRVCALAANKPDTRQAQAQGREGVGDG